MDNIAIGQKIKNARERVGLTQAALSALLGVDQSLISKIEKGERNLTTEMLNSISAFTLTPITALIGRKEYSQPTVSISYRAKEIPIEDKRALRDVFTIAVNQIEIDSYLKEGVHE